MTVGPEAVVSIAQYGLRQPIVKALRSRFQPAGRPISLAQLPTGFQPFDLAFGPAEDREYQVRRTVLAETAMPAVRHRVIASRS